jgi:hypothetical protein
MKLTLTRSQMLEMWRRIRAVEPLRLDCTVERTDGVDLDAMLADEMRAWYLHLLHTAPTSMLCPMDMTAQARVVAAGDGVAAASVSLPADGGVVRVLAVRFAGWKAAVAPCSTVERVMRLAANPYCTGLSEAALTPDGAVVASGVQGAAALTELLCVVDHGEEVYQFDDSALTEICDYNGEK